MADTPFGHTVIAGLQERIKALTAYHPALMGGRRCVRGLRISLGIIGGLWLT
jgi:hypothetical protein